MLRYQHSVLAALVGSLIFCPALQGEQFSIAEEITPANARFSRNSFRQILARKKASGKRLTSPLFINGSLELAKINATTGFNCTADTASWPIQLAIFPQDGKRINASLNQIVMTGRGSTKRFSLISRFFSGAANHVVKLKGKFRRNRLIMVFRDAAFVNGRRGCVFIRRGKFIRS